MKTVEHKLKSNPAKTVTIPESLVNGANRFIMETLKADGPNDLSTRIQKYGELKDYPIFSEALRLNSLHNRRFGKISEFLEKGDTLYLKFCLYNMYDLVKESNKVEHNEEEHNGLLNMMIPIMNTIRSLEDVEKEK